MAPGYAPPSVSRESTNMFDSVRNFDGYESWGPHELADYFENCGLADYREVLIYHKITGKIAPNLTDDDLKDMGIKIVGDRCRFRHILKSLGRKSRQMQREKILWDGQEQLWFDQCEGCWYTCCGIFPDDPSTYKLSNNHLRVKLVEPLRCGPIRLCCCNRYTVNNMDLTQVSDVDMSGVPAPFCQQILCCSDGKEIIDITYNDTPVHIILREGDGEQVTNLILNQIEESQMIERD